MSEDLVIASTPVDGVRVLAFNRPTKRNALSQQLITVFLEQLQEASRDSGVRVIVVTGSKSFFCGKEPTSHPCTSTLPCHAMPCSTHQGYHHPGTCDS
jgi:hypothetical protein